MTRRSTSAAVAPGIVTSTSTTGTLICGSSSRGKITAAPSASSTESTMRSGVSFELTNAFAIRPASPSDGHADVELGLQRAMGERRIARSEDLVAPELDAELGLEGVADIDLGQNAEPLGLECVHDLRERCLVARGQGLLECGDHR